MHHPVVTADPLVQNVVRPKAKPRAMSAEAADKKLSRIEPSIAVRPCIGPNLQRRFPQLRDLVSPTLRLPAHETPVFASSSQPPPPPSSHPLDGPEHALPSEAETTNQEEASGDVKDLERDNAESAGPRAEPAALAASVVPAASVGLPRAAADAPAPRKQRSRPFNIPRS